MPALIKIIITIMIAVAVSGCQNLAKKDSKVQVEDLSLEKLVNQNKSINRAINLLERGHNHQAQEHISEVLKANSNHSIALLLQQQLQLSAKQIFKTERFVKYKVKSGDSLGKIAKHWLGNPLYFVSLAKLNKIKNPLNLSLGIILKIPVTEQSDIVKQEKRRSKANIRLIKKLHKEKNFIQGLQKTNELFVVNQDMPDLLNQQQKILNSYAKSAISLSDRKEMLNQLETLSNTSRNLQQKSQYTNFIAKQNRLLFLDEALLLFQDESYLDAAKQLVNAKKIETKINSNNKASQIERQLLDKLHEQAVVFYRNHSLKEALLRWDLILQLQPDNDLAQKYTQRTQKLLQKLNQY